MRALTPTWRANSLSPYWTNEFDQLFDSFFDHSKHEKTFGVACDIEESEKFILFNFDLPGLNEADINIEIKDSVLHVRGVRSDEASDQSVRKYKGRRFGQFSQSFSLPKTVDQDKIEADYTNGVLKILLPKTEAAKPKRIEVSSNKGGFLSGLLSKSKEA